MFCLLMMMDHTGEWGFYGTEPIRSWNGQSSQKKRSCAWYRRREVDLALAGHGTCGRLGRSHVATISKPGGFIRWRGARWRQAPARRLRIRGHNWRGCPCLSDNSTLSASPGTPYPTAGSFQDLCYGNFGWATAPGIEQSSCSFCGTCSYLSQPHLIYDKSYGTCRLPWATGRHLLFGSSTLLFCHASLLFA